MSLQVIDAAGATQTINTLPVLGPAAAAASLPVVIASDQSAVPVSTSYGNLTAAPVSVGTGATLLAAARTGRGQLMLINESTTAVRIGGASVTNTTGALLPGVVGASITMPFSGALYGAVASGTATVSVVELF